MINKIVIFLCVIGCLNFCISGNTNDISTFYLEYKDSSNTVKNDVFWRKVQSLEVVPNDKNKSFTQNLKELKLLLKILVKNSEDSVFLYIEENTSKKLTKSMCQTALKNYGKSTFKESIYRNWALRDSSNLEFLPYHPNGVDLLLLIVENDSLNAQKRFVAMTKLANSDLDSYLSRLKKLENDTTILINAANSRSSKTLGKAVRDFITLVTKGKSKKK